MSDEVFNLPGEPKRVHIVDVERDAELEKRIAALETELRRAVAERDDCCAEATEWKSIIQRKGYDVVVLNTWRRERDIAQADARALAEVLAQLAEPTNWGSEAYYTYETGSVDASGNPVEREGRVELGVEIVWGGETTTLPQEIARSALSEHGAKYLEQAEAQ